MAELKTQGVHLYLLDADDTGNEVLKIGKVTGVTGVGGQAGEIDITNFDSVAKEFLVGLKDSGSVSVSLNFDPQDISHIKLKGIEGGDNYRFVLAGPETTEPVSGIGPFTLPANRTTIDFTAGVQSMPIEMSTDDAWRTSATLRVSGDYTIAPAV